VEWPFRILKRVFGFTKVRYRGLKKNHEWLLAAFALVNLYLHRNGWSRWRRSVSGERKSRSGVNKRSRNTDIFLQHCRLNARTPAAMLSH